MGGQKGQKVYRGLVYTGFYADWEFWKWEEFHLNYDVKISLNSVHYGLIIYILLVIFSKNSKLRCKQGHNSVKIRSFSNSER